mgnify:CR=1 FL=1
MTYTINGKELTELHINRRCAELMSWKELRISSVSVQVLNHIYHVYEIYDPCTNPLDTDAIIDKCFHKLVEYDHHNDEVEWEDIMDRHKCTKLVAACICFIEINEGKL